MSSQPALSIAAASAVTTTTSSATKASAAPHSGTSSSTPAGVTALITRKRSLDITQASGNSNGSGSSSPGERGALITFDCPICYSVIQDAYMTRCGHSFCHDCIRRCLDARPKCPLCSCDLPVGAASGEDATVVGPKANEQIFPNIALNDLIRQQYTATRRMEKAARLCCPIAGNSPAVTFCGVSGSSGTVASGAELGARIMQLLADDRSVSVDDVVYAMNVLQHKKREMEATSREIQLALLREFLEHSYKLKHDELKSIKSDIALLEQDLAYLDAVGSDSIASGDAKLASPTRMAVEYSSSVSLAANDIEPAAGLYSLGDGSGSSGNGDGVVGSGGQSCSAVIVSAAARALKGASSVPARLPEIGGQSSSQFVAGVNSPSNAASSNGSSCNSSVQAILSQRRFRMHAHFQCLEECYFSARQLFREDPSRQQGCPSSAPTSDLADVASASSCTNGSKSTLPVTGSCNKSGGNAWQRPSAPRGLERFAESLTKFTRYSQLRALSTLHYASDMLNSASIVSSIEFDKDNEYFAIAGVTKRIKMFEYSTVIRDDVDTHYPINEMVCGSKISCISWSSYHKSTLACSDYEGTVTLWDAYRLQRLRTFQEHERRCWSVDFNKVDTKLLASGSDDTKVKLWAINQEHSVTSIEAKANVCCVRFNPDSMYHLAMGSADHCVHYYDLRNCKTSLAVFKGHKKAVSYVKFLNAHELVSASTDSQLKLWKTDDPVCLRSFTGHVNEKNFVGLATDGDYIACGSENNSLYIYYKGLSTQIQTWSFRHATGGRDDGTVPGGGLPTATGDTNEFVSAVCWMSGSAVVVAANSQGTIKLLELV